MQPSSSAEVRDLYESSADSYADMMNSEIEQTLYTDTLGRLAERIADLSGALVDTSCGPGHMLQRYHELFDPDRSLIGIDLSPRMVELAKSRLGTAAVVSVADMRNLRGIGTASAAAVLSFFAIHHLEPDGVSAALGEWYRILRPEGQLMIATWEGSGPIDYGGASDVVAYRYSKDEITGWVREAGFEIDRCVVEVVEDMPMRAVYLDASSQRTSPA
jgi:ubiquinone/menaquinone biosynthesis C-methylase UbiE